MRACGLLCGVAHIRTCTGHRGRSTGITDCYLRCSSRCVRAQASQALRCAPVPDTAVQTAAAGLYCACGCHSAALGSSNSSTVHSATAGAAHGTDVHTELSHHQGARSFLHHLYASSFLVRCVPRTARSIMHCIATSGITAVVTPTQCCCSTSAESHISMLRSQYAAHN
jgi:hypothetical protein